MPTKKKEAHSLGASDDGQEISKAAAYAVGFELWKSSKDGFEFVDPLTFCVMSDPVEATDGYTYERKSILDWFRKYGALSPVTRESLSSQDVKPNDKLRQTIEKAMASTAAVGEKKTAADAEAVVCHDVITIRELNHIFAHLDPVRPVLNRTLADWKPPQVVVIGQESSGKSTLLERISMMSIFPRLLANLLEGVSTCTRIRIEVQLRNSDEVHIPELQIIDASTHEPIKGFETPKLVPAHNGHIDVRHEMDKLIASIHGSTADTYITDRIITLRVSGPQVPSIDLIDLPGIRQTGAGSEATKRMVDEHIIANAAHSLFLFVMKAGEVKANYSALAVVEKHKESHPSVLENSIGVLTMLDEFAPAVIPKKMHQVMTGEENLFKRYGWCATMNAPIGTETSGFKQLQLQAQREVDFFSDLEWPEDRKAELTTNNLVGQLNLMFKNYLKETWMPGAMKKLLARLQQINFDRFKLGIVAGSPPSEQDRAAAKEVERRIGAIMKPIRDAFNKEVLVALRSEVTRLLPSRSVLENHEVGTILSDLRQKVKRCVDDAVNKITKYWTDKVHECLTAKTEETRDQDTFGLTTVIKGLMSVQWMWPGVAAPSRKGLFDLAKKQSETAAFIQLSHYTDYTSKIREKCKAAVKNFQQNAKKNADFVLDRFVACDSPWLTLGPDEKCEKVVVVVDAVPFVNALVSAFVRDYPPDLAFMCLHEGVPLGKERADARALLDKFDKDYADVEGAIAAIKMAFSILPEDEAAMEREVEWEAAPGLPQAPAAAAADPTTPATPPSTSPDAPP